MNITEEQFRAMYAKSILRKGKPTAGDAVASGEEAKLHAAIKDYCRQKGWIAFHGAMSKATHRTKGEPDFIIAADHGRTLYVECKTKTGKLSAAQVAICAQVEHLGHRYHVVRSMREFLEVAGK